MKILVCVKQVPDTETKIKINSNGTGIDESGIKWVLNPYDEFAVEEALKLKEAQGDSSVTVLSVGPKKRIVDAMRTALAMGADEGLVVDCEERLDPYATAKILAAAINQEEESFDLCFTGKLAIDDNAASVSQMLAEFLEVPHTTVVSKFEHENGNYVVERETEGGAREVVQLNGPSVIGANKGLNTPRYATLPGIMKAKKKPMKEISLADLGIDPQKEKKVNFTNYQLPPEKPPVKMIEGEPADQAKELIRLLKDEAKVL